MERIYFQKFAIWTNSKQLDIHQRIQYLIDAKESAKASDFGKKAGIPKSTLSNIINSGKLPGFDNLEKILKAYPEVSAEWLMRGIEPVHNSEVPNKERPYLELNEDSPQYKLEKKADPKAALDEMEVLKKTVELLQIRMHSYEQEIELIRKELRKRK